MYEIKWVKPEDYLPEEEKDVLIFDGSRMYVARVLKGISEEDRQKMKKGELPDPVSIVWSLSTGYKEIHRSMLYNSADVHGNNRVPYCWEANAGQMKWFGQDVMYWSELPKSPLDGVGELE